MKHLSNSSTMFLTSFRNQIVQKLWIHWITVFFRKYKKVFFYSLPIFLLWNLIELILKIIVKLLYFCFFYQYLQIIVPCIGLALLSLYIFHLLSRILKLITSFIVFFHICFYYSYSKFIHFIFGLRNFFFHSIYQIICFSESLFLLPSFIKNYLINSFFHSYCNFLSCILGTFLILLKPLGFLPLLPFILDINNEYQRVIRILYYTIIHKTIRAILFFKLQLDNFQLKDFTQTNIKRLFIKSINIFFFIRLTFQKVESYEPSCWPIPLLSFIFKKRNWYQNLFIVINRKNKIFPFYWFLNYHNDLYFSKCVKSKKRDQFDHIDSKLIYNKEFISKKFQYTQKNYNSVQYSTYNNKNYLIDCIQWLSFLGNTNIHHFLTQQTKKNSLFNWVFQGPYRSFFENNNSLMIISSPEMSGYPFLNIIVEATSIPLIYLSCKDLFSLCNKENNLIDLSNYPCEFKFALFVDMAQELSPCILFLDDADFLDKAIYISSQNRIQTENSLEKYELDNNYQNRTNKIQNNEDCSLDYEIIKHTSIQNSEYLNFQDFNKRFRYVDNQFKSFNFKISEFQLSCKSTFCDLIYSYQLFFNRIRELCYEERRKNIFFLIYSKVPRRLDPKFFFYIKQIFYIKNFDPSIYCTSFKILTYTKKNTYQNNSFSIEDKTFLRIIDFINDLKFQNIWWTNNKLILKSLSEFPYLFSKKFSISNDYFLEFVLTGKTLSGKTLSNIEKSNYSGSSSLVRWEEIYYILGRITVENHLLVYPSAFLLLFYNIEHESNYYLSRFYIESSSSEPIILELSIMAQVMKCLSGLATRDLFILRFNKRNPWIFNYETYRVNEDLSLVYHLFQSILFQCYNTEIFFNNTNKEINKTLLPLTKSKNLLYMFEKKNQMAMRDWLFEYPIKTKSNSIRRTAPFSLIYTSTIWTIIRKSMNENVEMTIPSFHPYSNYRHKYFSLLPTSFFLLIEAPEESEFRKCIPERLHLTNNYTDFLSVSFSHPIERNPLFSKRKSKSKKDQFQALLSIKGDNSQKLVKLPFREDSLSLNTIWNKYEDGIQWLLNSKRPTLQNHYQVALWRDLEYMLRLYVTYMIRRMEKIDFFFPAHLSMMVPLRFYAGYSYIDPKTIFKFRKNDDISKIIKDSDQITPFSLEKPSEELWFGLNEKIIRVLSLTLYPYFQRPLLYLSMMRIWGHVISPPSLLSKAISSHAILHLIPSYIHGKRFDFYSINKIDSLIYSLVFDSYNYVFHRFLKNIPIFDQIINELFMCNDISQEKIKNFLNKFILFL
uniref:Cell division protein n=1 Tax=Nitellopsis obtusa TaxID=40811 RepID=A0A8F6YG87_9VIRI|nr:cell division protein [Nitellopsis obtusa]